MSSNRGDVRAVMIEAGRALYGARGYLGTSFADVLAETGAPRGSVYFHFPGGKAEYAAGVVRAHQRASEEFLREATKDSTCPGSAIHDFLVAARGVAASSDFAVGCAVAAVALDGAHAAPELREVVSDAMDQFQHALAGRLRTLGAPAELAATWSMATLAAYEGALVVARATKSPAPFDAVINATDAMTARRLDDSP